MQLDSRQKIWATLRETVSSKSRVLLTASGVATCVILLRSFGFLQIWELAALDQLFRLRPIEPVDERVVIVGINETDLKKAGVWPIPDAVMVELLQKIQTYQPRAIGLDIYRDLPVEPGHADLLQLYKSTPNLIGIQQIEDKNNSGVPAPPILEQRDQVGFNNLVTDIDGKVRRGLLYVETDNEKQFQSFALKLALIYLQKEGISPQTASSDGISLQLGKGVFRRFEPNNGSYTNVDNGGYQVLGNLRGPAGTFRTVSMSDLLDGKIPPAQLRDRIVLVGSTAVSLKDFFFTSYTNDFGDTPQPTAGVEVQANFVSQILSSALDGRSPLRVVSEPVEWLWIAGWALLGAQIIWSLRTPHQYALAMVGASSGLAGICYGVFLLGWWVPLIPPMMAMVGSAIVIIAHIAHLEEELKRSKEFLNSIINTIPDPIFVKDRQHRWIVLNQAYSKFLGYPLTDLIEKSDYDVFSVAEADVFRQQDQQVFTTAQEIENEETFTNKQGVTYHIATKRSLHKDAAGNLFLVGVIRDITERKRMEDELKRTAAELVRSNAELAQSASQLRHLANHDPLTGLPNRKLFQERLEQSLAWAAENDQFVGLLFLDLDGFKLINDTQGHDVGDLLLKSVAQRLTRCLRGSDTVSRLGGDEFTIILPAIPSAQDAGRVAEKILANLAKPFDLEGHTIFVTTSIGISLFPQHGGDGEELVKQADNAMYEAKELGKNRYEFAFKETGNVVASPD